MVGSSVTFISIDKALDALGEEYSNHRMKLPLYDLYPTT
jgi:hypothetical protein